MGKPSLIFVHGAWHTAECWDQMIAELQGVGYRCVTMQLPSSQSMDTPPASLQNDVDTVRKTVTDELNQSNEVLVIAHSYGGHVVNRALVGFDSKSRAGKAAVQAIAFITAIPIPSGMSFIGSLGGKPGPLHNVQGDFVLVADPPGSHQAFYNDLSDDEAMKWVSKIRAQSWKAKTDVSDGAAYLDIPPSYLYCTKDIAWPLQYQQLVVGWAKDAGAEFVVEETVESGHSPFLSMPKRTAEFIRRVAAEKI